MAAEDSIDPIDFIQKFEINPYYLSQDSIDSNDLVYLYGWTICSAAASSDFTHHHTPCSAANISPSSNKRRSPDSTAETSDQIPNKRPKKKLFLEPLESNVRRSTISPPFSSFAATDPESAAVNISETTANLSLPPRPPPCSPIKSLSRSASNNDLNADGSSDYYQRLKWMKDYTREMSQLLDYVMPDEPVIEEEEDDKATEEDDSTDTMKANLVTDSEESFYVERKGNNLILMFKCPCGKAFKILISGANCYYKLL